MDTSEVALPALLSVSFEEFLLFLFDKQNEDPEQTLS